MGDARPWSPVGTGDFNLQPPPAATTAQLRCYGLAWLLGTALWSACTLYPLLREGAAAAAAGAPPPLSLALRLALGTAASLLLVWALWVLQALHRARVDQSARFL